MALHVNLAYGTLACFMRFPVINHLLQAIVNSMGFETTQNHYKQY